MHARHPSPDAQATPYAGLTPDFVLDALDGVGLRGDGRILQLNSYENRVFQVFLEDGTAVVAKFYRPGRWTDEQILEEHEFSAELAAGEIPVVAPLTLAAVFDSRLEVRLAGARSTLASASDSAHSYRFSVSPRRAGGAPSLESDDQLEWIGRFIGRIHLIGATRSFAHRHTLSVAEFGWSARDWLLSSELIPPDALPEWKSAVDGVLDLTQAAFDDHQGLRTLRLHGDCHVGNILWTDAGPHFVDLDDALNGPAMQDLWMLLPGETQDLQHALRALLRGYETFMEFDDGQLSLIEPLRTLRLIHHSAWLARRWSDPAFPIAFPWFGETSYWRQQAQVLREQLQVLSRRTSS